MPDKKPARTERTSTKTAPSSDKIPASARNYRESEKALKARALKIVNILKETYPEAKCALEFSSPLEILVATILSAQCTDVRVNIVTKELFKKYKSPKDYLAVPQEELEKDIHSTGFYRQKAKSIRGCSEAIVAAHGGKVPADMDSLTALPVVGRKTANVVMGECFGWPAITVDTHMGRVAARLALTKESDPVKIEMDLRKVIPEDECTLFTHRVITHGRQICAARKPQCAICPLSDLCPSSGKI